MIPKLLKRLFHFQEMILLLSLAALVCVPIALSKLVRDASTCLLLPITLSGATLAWLLAGSSIHKRSSGIILFFLGPLSLLVRIGQLGAPLLELLGQTFKIIPPLYHWFRFETLPDISLFATAASNLSQQTLIIVNHLALWVNGFFQKSPIEDPVGRTLFWSLVLWMVAIWAGWQIRRNKHLLLGILPSTILLGFVLDYTGKQTETLWIHLGLLLFLTGLNSYATTQQHWDQAHIDYAESTSLDTLVTAGMLTVTLVLFAYLGSSISIKDILEDMRERRAASHTTSAESLGLQAANDNHRVGPSSGGLPRSHLVGAGPELSTQVAMSISTGDLPPMSQYAQVPAPRYYWRAQTYQIYTGSGWANPSTTYDEIDSDQLLFEPNEQNMRIVHQRVTFPDERGQLFWSGTLLSADVPFQAVWNHKTEQAPPPNLSPVPDVLAALAPVKTYQADSALLKLNVEELRNSPSVYPAWVQNQFLTLPESVPERVLSLARDLTAGKSNPYDRAVAIQNYLREFPYTLDVPAPPSGRDVADYFIFDLKQGYCDYYASSMVVLARAAGLPARLVIGYANGTYDYERAKYIVTENYAHSWVEVYFAGIGWVEFEPTASQPLISYDEKIKEETPQPVAPQQQSLGEQAALFLERITTSAWIPLIGLMIAIALWVAWDSLRVARLKPVQAIQFLFKRLRRLAYPLSGQIPVEQTAHQFSFALIEKILSLNTSPRIQYVLSPSRDEIDRLTDLYSRSLFASSSPSHAEIHSAVKTWSRLRWRLLLANLLAFRKK